MSLSSFALVHDRWRTTTKLPFARVGSRSAMLDGRCYLVGGYDDESRSADEELGPPARCFDVATARWSHFRVPRGLLSDGQQEFFRPVVAACHSKLYLFLDDGGLVFDPATADWSRINDHPLGEYVGEAACELDDAIYLAGGGGDNKQLWRFQSADGTWERNQRDMPGQGRQEAVAVSLNGLLYVIGGLRHGKHEDAMLIYHPSHDEWRCAPAIPAPQCGYPNPRQLGFARLSAAAHEGSVVVMGSGPPITYSPATEAWLESEKLASLTLSMGEYHVPEGHDDMHPAACGRADYMDEEELEDEDEYLQELTHLPIESPQIFSVAVDVAAL